MVGGGTAAAFALGGAIKNIRTGGMPSPMALRLGLVAGGAMFSSVLAAHVLNGSNDQRMAGAIAGAGIAAAGGMALTTWKATHNPVQTAISGVLGLGVGAVAGFVTSPFTITRPHRPGA